MERYKIEIIDDQISNCYQTNLYRFKKVSRWYQLYKEDWGIEYRHILGKKYVCPEIYQKRITIEQYFERDVKQMFNDYNIEEVHKIIIKSYESK